MALRCSGGGNLGINEASLPPPGGSLGNLTLDGRVIGISLFTRVSFQCLFTLLALVYPTNRISITYFSSEAHGKHAYKDILTESY